MPAPHIDTPELKCPHCGYLLHGLLSEHHDVMRCPECGGLTTVMAIVDEHARKRRGDRQILAVCMLILSLVGLLALGPDMIPPLNVREFGWLQLMILLASFVACCLAVQRRYSVSNTVLISFSLITAVLFTALLHNIGSGRLGQPLSLLLFAMWIVGFHWWAVNRQPA